MPIVVEVKEVADYEAWLTGQQAARQAAAQPAATAAQLAAPSDNPTPTVLVADAE